MVNVLTALRETLLLKIEKGKGPKGWEYQNWFTIKWMNLLSKGLWVDIDYFSFIIDYLSFSLNFHWKGWILKYF